MPAPDRSRFEVIRMPTLAQRFFVQAGDLPMILIDKGEAIARLKPGESGWYERIYIPNPGWKSAPYRYRLRAASGDS